MRQFFKKNKYYALCGNNDKSVLAEVYKSSTGVPALKVIAMEDGPPTNPEIVNRLLLKGAPAPGKVSMAFPLEMFEIVNLSLPVIPEEALGKALPYHLSKVIDKPLGEYIYDWQITRQLKDQLQIAVFLFPEATFKKVQNEFKNNKLEVSHFEADVFASFAFLDWTGSLKNKAISMGIIIWLDSISFAVCEKGRLVLSRSVKLDHPSKFTEAIAFVDLEDEIDGASVDLDATPDHNVDVDVAFEVEGVEDEKILGYDQGESILAGFDILSPESAKIDSELDVDLFSSDSDDETFDEKEIREREVLARTPWVDYLETINLEIMRTRDYYSSVLKGQQIENYYVLGAENFFDQLMVVLQQSIGENVEIVLDKPDDSECDTQLHVIGLGTGIRW